MKYELYCTCNSLFWRRVFFFNFKFLSLKLKPFLLIIGMIKSSIRLNLFVSGSGFNILVVAQLQASDQKVRHYLSARVRSESSTYSNVTRSWENVLILYSKSLSISLDSGLKREETLKAVFFKFTHHPRLCLDLWTSWHLWHDMLRTRLKWWMDR